MPYFVESASSKTKRISLVKLTCQFPLPWHLLLRLCNTLDDPHGVPVQFQSGFSWHLLLRLCNTLPHGVPVQFQNMVRFLLAPPSPLVCNTLDDPHGVPVQFQNMVRFLLAPPSPLVQHTRRSSRSNSRTWSGFSWHLLLSLCNTLDDPHGVPVQFQNMVRFLLAPPSPLVQHTRRSSRRSRPIPEQVRFLSSASWGLAQDSENLTLLGNSRQRHLSYIITLPPV